MDSTKVFPIWVVMKSMFGVQIWVVNLKLITTQIGKTFVLSLPCPRPEMPY